MNKMTKYGKDVLLTSTEENGFRTVRFSVAECESPQAADNELTEWINDNPELLEVTGNKKIIKNTLKPNGRSK